jgi:Tfp pilus assembly protein PilF
MPILCGSRLNRVIAVGALVGSAALPAPTLAAPANDIRICSSASGEAAIAACTRAIESSNFKGRSVAGLYIMRGVILRNQGEHDRAIADYGQAIRLDPNYASAYTGRAMAYRGKGDLDRAIADYGEAIRLDPKRAFVYHLRGNAYRAKDEIDRAIADYDQAIRLDPKLAAVYYDRGVAYNLKAEIGRALADYDQAIRLDRKLFLAYTNRALIHLALDQLDRAIADYDAALKLDAKQPEALYGRGIAKLRRGDAGGNADIAAAKALQGDVGEMFARAGLVAPGSAAASTPTPRSEVTSTPAPAPLPAPKLPPPPLPPVTLGGSVKAIFEKHNLLGIFAADCGKPVSKDNLYYVNRLLDADHVQRDQMSGPTMRDFVIFIDQAGEMNSSEVAVSGTRDGKPTNIIWRIERAAGGTRVQAVEASWGGQKLISGEKVPGSGREVPWLNRCGG